MPTATKPKADEIYVAVISFAGNDVNVAQGDRLRGNNEISPGCRVRPGAPHAALKFSLAEGRACRLRAPGLPARPVFLRIDDSGS